MAKEWAKPFYNSKEWIECRASYIRKMPIAKRGLCERCYLEGKHVKGDELHHKIHLNQKNIHDRRITLNHSNLILLCKECHREIHGDRTPTQYVYDDNGELIPNPKYHAPI